MIFKKQFFQSFEGLSSRQYIGGNGPLGKNSKNLS